jgi:hypothetical protein
MFINELMMAIEGGWEYHLFCQTVSSTPQSTSHLNPLASTGNLIVTLCHAEKTEHSLKPSARKAYSYGYPFKSSSLAEYKGYIIPAPKDECYLSHFLSSTLVFLKRFLH